MLGRVFKSGRNSALDTAQYKKLPQEEEEEDNVLFKRDGVEISHKQNGVHADGGDERATANGTTPDSTETLPPSSEIPELVQVRVYKAPRLTRTRLACYSLSVIFCLLLASLFAFVIPYTKMFHRLVVGKTYDATPPWNKTFPDSVSDSPVRLIDIDKDDRMDFMFAISSSHSAKAGESFMECKSQDKHYPCASKLYAIRGYDGKEFWNVDLEGAVVAINCGQSDSSSCLISGHRGLLVKVNAKTGKIMWSAKDNKIGDRVVVHHPLVLPDFNGDKVSDIVVSVTGDQAFRNFGVGKLILISGDSGSVLGKPFTLPVSSSMSAPPSKKPNAPATNIPPLIHTLKDSSQYILYGSGGLNQPGGLYGIALPVLVRRIMGWNNSHAVPNTAGLYKAWVHATTDEKTGVIRIWESSTKGIAVPPVCADVTQDGTNDILVTTATGSVILYDGETLNKVWEFKVDDPKEEYETLSQPGPGYFNNDKKLDFMLHLNRGTWPKYSQSKAVIIDGKSGLAMWTYNSSHPEFTSDLVITMKKHRDAFLIHLPIDQKARQKRYSRGRQWPPRRDPNNYPPRQGSDDGWLPYPEYTPNIAFGSNRGADQGEPPYNNNPYQQEYDPNYEPPSGISRQKYDKQYETEGGPTYIDRTGRKHPNIPRPRGPDKTNNRGRPVLPSAPKVKETPFHPCAMSQMINTGDVFLMDRTTMKNPIRIAKHQSPGVPVDTSDCSVYHHGASIGAVGDIDGDIHHEVILMFHTYENEDGVSKPAMNLQKINLKDALQVENSTAINVQVTSEVGNGKQLKSLQSKLLLHDGVQHWTQYMGKSGKSIY